MGEDSSTSIIYTAGEINLGLTTYGDLVVDIVPKAFGRLAHKSLIYASIC